MITGRVRENGDPVIRVKVYGNANGIIHEVEAVIDTGFTEFLSLPNDLIDLLSLPVIGPTTVEMADGGSVEVFVYSGEIEWNGKRITIDVQSDAVEPLVGMGLLWGHTFTVRGETDGLVTVKAFDEEMMA